MLIRSRLIVAGFLLSLLAAMDRWLLNDRTAFLIEMAGSFVLLGIGWACEDRGIKAKE